MRHRTRASTAVVVALVLAGMLASVLGARAIARSDADKARLAFHLASSEVAASLRQSIVHEEDLVVSASGFFAVNPSASPADFDRWLESVHALSRFPELQNIGLVVREPAAGLAALKARLAAHPVLPFGPRSKPPEKSLQVLPAGSRPYYCLAVAGIARSFATYLPAGVDYCALTPQLVLDSEYGLAAYAPEAIGGASALGVATPVYRSGATPASAAARKRAFVGWVGEWIEPSVVLSAALQGHAGLAVTFHYKSRFSSVTFSRGSAPAGGQRDTVPLVVGRVVPGTAGEGWTLTTVGSPLHRGVLDNLSAKVLLFGGSLLSVLVGLLILILVTGRRRALSMVREKTAELSEKNRELSHLALHDTLTGLPNRALVIDRAEQLLARAARQPEVLVGALFIDVDDFKRVNDNLGHSAGDQLLRAVGERLRSAVRDQDTVGRIGGDEFVVLGELTVAGITLDHLATRIVRTLREPVELQDTGELISVTASVGVATGHYATPDALLRDADQALYAAKAAGKNCRLAYDADLNHAGSPHT